jgi:hypothetical protein
MGEVRGSIPLRAYQPVDPRPAFRNRPVVVETKQRIGFLEGQYAKLSSRVDRMAGDIALIKRRLNLLEA